MQPQPQPNPAKNAAIMLVVAAVLIVISVASKNWITVGRGGREETAHFGPMGLEVCEGSMCIDRPTGRMPGDVELIMTLALISGFASAALAGWTGGAMLAGKGPKSPPVKLTRIAFWLASFSFTFFVIRAFSEGGSGVGPGWAMFTGIGGAVLASIALKKATPFIGSSTALMPATVPIAWAPGSPQGQGLPWAPQQPPPGFPQQTPNAQQPHAQQSQPMQPHGLQPQQPFAQPQQAFQQPQPYSQQQPHAQHSHTQPPHAQQPQHPQTAGATPAGAPAAVPSCPRCGQPLQFVAQYQRWFCAREQQYV